MSQAASSRYLPNDFFAGIKARGKEIEARFRALTPASAEMHKRASESIPGGFSRDAVIRSPYAPYIVEGHGSEVVDLDRRRYVDFCYNATSLVLGHADPRVIDAVDRQAHLGTAFYAPNTREVELAELICERVPSAERMRFTNSGSEAVMMAIRIARGHTGRDLLVKFEGSYHGTYDDVQWSVSPPADALKETGLPSPVADTAGLASGDRRVIVLPYNDAKAITEVMSRRGSEVAAVIVEPMANRMGLILPDSNFLQAVIEACHASGAVAIFDEVIAFRLGYNGCQGNAGLTPDLTTLGKCIGGGLPVGGVAGRADILARTEPGAKGRVTHAGTFNGNPLTMVAGLATMEAMTPDAFDAINARGEQTRARLSEACEGLPLTVTGAGSLFKVNATEHEIRDYRGSATVDHRWQELLSLALANEGFLLSKGLQGCVSTATTEGEIDNLIEAFGALVRA